MRRRNRNVGHTAFGRDEYTDVCMLWLLRLTQNVTHSQGNLRDLIELIDPETDLFDEDSEEVDDDRSKGSRLRAAQLRRHLRILQDRIEQREQRKPSLDGTPLSDNLRWLGARLGFDEIDRDICALAVLLEADSTFQSKVRELDIKCTTVKAMQLIACMINCDPVRVRNAFAIEAPLASSGLVLLNRGVDDLERMFQVPDKLSGILLASYDAQEQMLRHFFSPASPAKLAADDFPHLAADFRLLHEFLARALAATEVGVNVLLYGEPGTGKSEFARVLAASVGASLQEVGATDEDGDGNDGEDRLKSFLLCQRILGKAGDSMVLFDEIEDVFPAGLDILFSLFGIRKKSSGPGKAWINHTLETNPVPAIWISNSVDHIDPAYLRRFDFALEIPTPPAAVRSRIASKYFDRLPVGSDWLANVAGWKEATPAQLEKAARIASLVGAESAQDAEAVAERALRASARLLGQAPLPARKCQAPYSLEFVATSASPAELIAGLRRTGHGSFCFHGPAGTGKTALARHMTEALGRPLLVKRASDLLSKWVGGSEKNIAAMFREAEAENAVLVLDEADSLLADRRDASHGWEITQVNEMLSQMEDFAGIFVCTTNLMDRLDAASLRRFDFKVRFDFLAPGQRIALMHATWPELPNPLPGEASRQLAALDHLTLGDFAVVARQRTLTGAEPNAEDIVDSLAEECRIKGYRGTAIGFHA